MKQQDLLKREEILTPEEDIEVHIVLAENTALHTENATLHTENATLHTENATLHTENTVLHTENAVLKEENAELKERLAWFEKQVYGRKSEKSEIVLESEDQLSMFDEAEQTADIDPKDFQTTEVKSHKRRKRTRDEIMAELPVEEVLHTVEDKTCGKCGSEMEVIGKEKLRDELVYIPAHMFLRRHMAEVVKCVSCGMDEDKDRQYPDIEKCNILTAKAPSPMIPYSFCSPELLAHIVYEKYCNAVPLNRLEKDFAAKGVNISRTTMANWVITAAHRWVEPVWEQMRRELIESSVIHADETVVQVLNEPGRKAKTDSRMWVYCNGKINEHSNILFEYTPTRNGDNAVKFLGDYRGFFICDGYDGYNKLKNAVRCGCWAHVRRKFVDALPSDKSQLSTSYAAKGVEYCNQLFLLERKYDGKDERGKQITGPLTPEQRYKKRLSQSKPVVDAFFAWLDSFTTVGGSGLAKAVQYAKNEKKYLYRFLKSGEIPIDNNRAENAVRPFCIGRKNWLFSASVKGAKASAMLYSVVATYCANGKNVEEYLTELFRHDAGTVILPW